MNLRTPDYGSLRGKKVLVRVDFNVPLKDGIVSDDTRIRAHLPTLKALKDAGAIVALASHLGRPKGKINPEFSLKAVVPAAEKLLGTIEFVEDCVGPKVEKALKNSTGKILLLENTRFHKEEEANDPDFSRSMAAPFEVFLLDAFSASHRAHASTVGVQEHLDSYAGYLLDEEIAALSKVRDHSEPPFVLVLGGAKVSDKIGVIDNLMSKVSSIVIGGGMAFTFLKAKGGAVGRSLLDEGHLEFAASMLEKAANSGVTMELPVDVVAATSIEDLSGLTSCPADGIPDDLMGLDIGPESVKAFSKIIEGAKTILWNGPSGVFEVETFSRGTKGLCDAVAKATSQGAFSVVGGGDTASAVSSMGYRSKVSHVSTGGGASLEFCEGKVLPGIAPLILD
ncbi:phosphoglycerate kinase [Dethiosulfovibrio sp. F2B]|uniref:phosphoglycerate kinase n=1 Tax=Dethiosulfovibrio faecalis TaxID=2720018 RepID=UPI001F1663AB|nr:phosphoglycerate kinase [Dethiosulfovibrio faecalis]MCF4150518.1 phosphoglycerate kinase [Dethiosulfovibrio faecalis]